MKLNAQNLDLKEGEDDLATHVDERMEEDAWDGHGGWRIFARFVVEKMIEVERIWEKREKGKVKNEVIMS